VQNSGTTRTLQTVKDSDGQVTSRVRRTVLPSGLRIVTEQMAGARSASIGVWVGVGSRDETPALHGCSHFLEHLLFKGTRERSALDISVALDAVGGEFNAFTAKEYTCFHARVLDTDLPLAIDVLGDMVNEPDESFEIRLSSPVHAVLGGSIAVGTIVDDDRTAGESDAGPLPVVLARPFPNPVAPRTRTPHP